MAPHSRLGSAAQRSASTFSGSALAVRASNRLNRPTWVSTGRPGKPKATLRTTLPVLRPTPGNVTKSSSRVGTWQSKRSHSAWARPMMFLALTRKKPVGRTSASTAAGSATARSSGEGNWRNKAGVTALTRSSVVWADSTVATNNCHGVEKSSSHSSAALPRYS